MGEVIFESGVSAIEPKVPIVPNFVHVCSSIVN